jgi:antitoxin component of MazEF toxin-antitoxin module
VIGLIRQIRPILRLDWQNFECTCFGMLFELKLQKMGDAVGVVLPPEVLSQLDAAVGDTVHLVSGPEGRFFMSAQKGSVSEQMRIFQDIMVRYQHTLKELAKH